MAKGFIKGVKSELKKVVWQQKNNLLKVQLWLFYSSCICSYNIRS